VGAILVAVDLPPNLMGNYRIPTASPARNAGAASKAVPAYQQLPATINAPPTDIDGQTRPSAGAFDVGADEVVGTVP